MQIPDYQGGERLGGGGYSSTHRYMCVAQGVYPIYIFSKMRQKRNILLIPYLRPTPKRWDPNQGISDNRANGQQCNNCNDLGTLSKDHTRDVSFPTRSKVITLPTYNITGIRQHIPIQSTYGRAPPPLIPFLHLIIIPRIRSFHTHSHGNKLLSNLIFYRAAQK